MRAVAWNLTVIAALFAAALGFATNEAPVHSTTARPETLRVIDIEIVSTNRVKVGTNTMSLTEATNVIARYGDTVDLIAIHGPIGRDASVLTTPSTALHIARAGLPLVLVEKDGEYAWREQSSSAGVRTVKIGSDQFATLRRLWERNKNPANTPPRTVLQTTVDWDTAAGSYKLKRIELGLLGERVWLVHEHNESDNESEIIGIQFKKEW